MTIKQELQKYVKDEDSGFAKVRGVFTAYFLTFLSATAILISINKLFSTGVPVDFWTTLSVVLLIEFIENIADRMGGKDVTQS